MFSLPLAPITCARAGVTTSLCGYHASLCGYHGSLCGYHGSLCGYHASLCGCHGSLCGCHGSLCGYHGSLCGYHRSLCGYHEPSRCFAIPGQMRHPGSSQTTAKSPARSCVHRRPPDCYRSHRSRKDSLSIADTERPAPGWDGGEALPLKSRGLDGVVLWRDVSALP